MLKHTFNECCITRVLAAQKKIPERETPTVTTLNKKGDSEEQDFKWEKLGTG